MDEAEESRRLVDGFMNGEKKSKNGDEPVMNDRGMRRDQRE